MKKRYKYFYERHGLKTVTTFLTPENFARLKLLAKDEDTSTARYVRRMLEKHIELLWRQRLEETYKQGRIKPLPSK